MNLESRVTVKDSSSFIPDDDAITDVCLSGNVTELHIVEKKDFKTYDASNESIKMSTVILEQGR